MSAANTTRWIGIGLLSLPLYGALTFWSALNPQPDPNTHLEAWLATSPPTATCSSTCLAASSA
jgi:hypothetical protein